MPFTNRDGTEQILVMNDSDGRGKFLSELNVFQKAEANFVLDLDSHRSRRLCPELRPEFRSHPAFLRPVGSAEPLVLVPSPLETGTHLQV